MKKNENEKPAAASAAASVAATATAAAGTLENSKVQKRVRFKSCTKAGLNFFTSCNGEDEEWLGGACSYTSTGVYVRMHVCIACCCKLFTHKVDI